MECLFVKISLREVCLLTVCVRCVELILKMLCMLWSIVRVRLVSGIRIDVSTCAFSSFWWNLFWSLLWGIWLRRNAWIFENKKVVEFDVIKKAVSVVGEFEIALEASSVAAPTSAPTRQVWTPPSAGCYKVNSDAACFVDGYVGLGGVMRDHTGDVMVATCVKQKGCGNVDVAEASAARHAVSIAIEAGLDKIELETDSMNLFNLSWFDCARYPRIC
ncbi:uncharacterized protein LOC110726204 [Chenopodium quinoa]|uniref:uncharacterized protein LOC110726204 n=1 Tax=Chenopodium quinoa TaxID=63459 RepID=UPI000B78BF98|nr:uncharacterized protein LOC110726204 [Chenopodium quinoa]